MNLSPVRSLAAGMLLCLGTLTSTAACAKPPAHDLLMLAEARTDNQTKRHPRRTDEAGRHYDAGGRYLGRTDENGRSYDAGGRYLGRTDENGRSYDAGGRYQGRTDENGRSYDAGGRYQGRFRKDD
ncbi:MAG: hypothetical protein Q4D19_00475 [Lautropia sp.]|nr:hypothetical protein [Lautropia sp.]